MRIKMPFFCLSFPSGTFISWGFLHGGRWWYVWQLVTPPRHCRSDLDLKKMGKREGWPPHLSTAYKLYQLDWTAVLVLVEVKNLFPWWNNLKYMAFQKSVDHPIKKRNLSHRDGLLGSWSWDDQPWLRVQWHPSMVMSMGESSEKAKAQKTRFASV